MTDSFEIDRLSTGVKGLDEMLKGGIPKKAMIELAGTPGTGKTTLAMDFIIEGIKNNEKGLYYSFEQQREEIISSLKPFGREIEDYEDKGLFELIYTEPPEETNVTNSLAMLGIEKKIKETGAKRLVFDSLNVLLLHSSSLLKSRHYLKKFLMFLKEQDVTAIFLLELGQSISDKFTFNAMDFLFDGVIVLDNANINGILKGMVVIPKMRYTQHDKTIRPLIFSKEGIKIDPSGKIYV